MHTYRLEREQWLPQPVDVVFSFFSRPENLQAITPPWLDFRMVETPELLAIGSLIRYRLRWRWLPLFRTAINSISTLTPEVVGYRISLGCWIVQRQREGGSLRYIMTGVPKGFDSSVVRGV